jgi:transposase-like protein
MDTRKRRRYSDGYKAEVMDRLRLGEKMEVLKQELEVSRSVLYRWWGEARRRPNRRRAAGEEPPCDLERQPPVPAQLPTLQARIAELEGALGRRTLELDFFQSALRRLAESGPGAGANGETSSRLKSAAGWNRKAH